jgi:DNA-binding LacI/PurR family transcriptional regulator
MRTKQQQETRRNRPNLRTIAERVDLSPTAVSLALRGDSSIPLETRQRVLTAAEELDYKYIPRSRKSGQKRLRRLVFVIHDYGDQSVTANPFYGHILTGVEQACRQKHASLSFVVLQHDYPKTTALPPVLTHELDGILLTSPYPPELIKRISREASGQIVLIDNIYPGSPYDSVMADDFGGAYLATQHLIACGHQQIVLLTGTIQHPTIIPSFQQRYWGYCAACSAAGISPLPPAVFPAHLDQEILTIGGKQEGYRNGSWR